MYNFPMLMGAPPGSEGAPQSSEGSFLRIAMIVAVIAVFWFLIIRPQRKKQKDTQKMLSAIAKGDKVSSIGGIRGTVKNVLDNTVVVEVDNKGATLEFSKSAIGSVENAASETAPSKKTKSGGESAAQTD